MSEEDLELKLDAIIILLGLSIAGNVSALVNMNVVDAATKDDLIKILKASKDIAEKTVKDRNV